MSSTSPWPLAPLPWQAALWAPLVQALENQSAPHALLFSGTEGIGKLQLARSLAALLLCGQPRAGTACGECRSCHLLDVGNHADFLMVEPEEGSRVIKIDQVRTLIDFGNRTASLGQRKVILLTPAENLNVNAANALLKSLEEPAENTHLLLVSHRPSGLPATVRSRCQMINHPVPDRVTALTWLDTLTGSSDVSTSLLDACAGRPIAAQALFLNDGLKTRQALLQGVAALASGQLSAVEFPGLVAELELVDVLELFIESIQASIRQQSLDALPVPPAIFVLLDDITRLRAAVGRGANPNRQLTVEDIAARLTEVFRP